MSSHVRYEYLPPTLLASMGWSPELFAGPAAVAIRAGVSGSTLTQMGARLIDGWRASETPGSMAYDPCVSTTPIYRQAEIGQYRLVLDEQHWNPPQITGRWCVQPDDVVVNKLTPVRASLVTPNAKRHPVDGNSIIVRGLPRREAAWLSVCLNRPAYEQLLVAESGVLKRVGLGALSALRLPPAPPEMDALAARLCEISDELALNDERIHNARTEALAEANLTPYPAISLSTGHFAGVRTVTNENWLPSWIALRAEQAALAEEHGWVALGDLAHFSKRDRLGAINNHFRSLRLSDVAENLFIPADDQGDRSGGSPTRLLAKPLLPGEVLVSTLGNSFRAAYVDDEVPAHIFPVDSWVRLRFRETPAAWALILSTAAIRSQAARLAIGSAQQFVPPDALRMLRLPTPPREVRDRWQRAVERHHAQRRALDRRWSDLLTEMSSLFDAVHRPFRSCRALVTEVTQ